MQEIVFPADKMQGIGRVRTIKRLHVPTLPNV